MTNPFNLTATNQGSNVILAWGAAEPADGYYVYRGATLIGTVDGTVLTFTDTTALPGTLYTWKVIAFSACGLSGPATANGTTDCAAPGDPAGITATQDGQSVLVTWVGASRASGYTLERSAGSGYTTVYTGSLTSFTDNTVVLGTTYTYRVTSFNACQTGSTVVSSPITPGCGEVLGPPVNLVVTPLTQTGVSVEFNEITFSDNTHPTSYVIERRPGTGGSYAVVNTVTDYSTQMPYSDLGLSPATDYCYRVKATGGICVDSSYTAEQCVTTLGALPCNSSGSIFSWTAPRRGEPENTIGATNATDYMLVSPTGAIDLSDPRIVKVQFAAGSDLDDILILMKDTDTITESWDGTYPHPVAFSIPQNSIIFASTFGYYVSNSNPAHRASAMKTLNGVDGFGNVTKTITLPFGDNDIASLSFDGSNNAILKIVGFQGGCASSFNGTHTMPPVSGTQWSGGGWSISRTGTPGSTNYIWGIYKGATLAYSADANANTTPPTATYEWVRVNDLGCQNSEGAAGMGYQDIVSAGFTVRNFSSGVTKADLQAAGLINTNGSLDFKFAHIVCGQGYAYVQGLTCSDGNGSSSSCSPPSSPSGLSASVSGNEVTLTWTDNSSGTAQTVIERLGSITGSWAAVGEVDAATTTYTDPITTGSYAYRVYARNSCGNSGYSNYKSITVPCNCNGVNPIPTTIQVAFDSISGCACFTTGQGGSSNATVTVLGGPYTLTGDGTTYSWSGTAGMLTLKCHTSLDCSDGSPVTYSGPANITVSISGGVLTVQAAFGNSCCTGAAPNVFHATQTVSCSGGLFVLDNAAQSQGDCACSGTGGAFGGHARVYVSCELAPCPRDTYTVTFNNLVPDAACLAGTSSAVLYESDAIDGQTFTLTRDTVDRSLFKYETGTTPLNVRLFESSTSCAGGYLLPIKFGIYLHYTQIAGDNATLLVKSLAGSNVDAPVEIVAFSNAGIAVSTSSFLVPNEISGYSFTADGNGRAFVMKGGSATLSENCAGSSSSSSSSSGANIPCSCDGSGVTICGTNRRQETAGAQMYVTTNGITICTPGTCIACADTTGTYQSLKVTSLNPNQRLLLTYVSPSAGWQATLPCQIDLYTTSSCSGSPAATVNDLTVSYTSSNNTFRIQSAALPSGGIIRVFEGTAGSVPDTCPLVIENFWASDTPCGSEQCAVVAGGGTVTLAGCSPGVCPGTCDGCCEIYTVVVSGASGAGNGTYMLQSPGTCVWSDSEPSQLSIVNGEWRLTLGDSSGRMTWVSTCSPCPSTNPADWYLITNTYGGTPTFTMTAVLCQTSSSSSGGPIVVGCDFQQDAGGGDEGYDGLFSFDTSIYGPGQQRFYFTYNTFVLPDRVIVSRNSDGHVYLDSGCVGTQGDVTVPITLQASDSPIRVRVLPNCAGGNNTGWKFSLNCEARTHLGDMQIVYDWSANPRRDLDSGTILNIPSPESGGFGCGINAQQYITFGGDNTSPNGSEQSTVKLGQAYFDGQWTGSTTIDLYACWYNSANAGNSTDPWTFTISVTWQGVTQSVNLTTQVLNTSCCNNKVCTVTAHEDGTFALSCGGCAAPTPPAGVNATYTNINGTVTATITWNAVTAATGYEVERSYDGTTWGPINGTVTGTTATDNPNNVLVANQNLYYRVRTLVGCGSGSWSSTKQIVVMPPVQNFAVNGFVNPIRFPQNAPAQGVTLAWTNDPATATALQCLRNSANIGTQALNALTYNDTSSVPDATYTYAVKTTNADGYSMATLSYTVCDSPTVSNIVAQNQSPSQVHLSWDSSLTGGNVNYEIFISTDGTNYTYYATTGSLFADITGLSANTLYWFAVRAVVLEATHQCRAGLLAFDTDTTAYS